MQDSSGRTAGGHQRTRGWLVAAEVALALVLLVSAGLLLRSIDNVFAVPVGFDPSHLLTMQVQQTPQRLRAEGASDRVVTDTVAAVRAVPGVAAAAFTTLLPLSGDVDTYGVRFEFDRDANERWRGAALCRHARLLRRDAHPPPPWPPARCARRQVGAASRD